MKRFSDIAIPHVGIELDITMLYHTLRDIFFILILWQLGYRGFQAAFTLLLLSGFFEAGNGICYNEKGLHDIFNPLDVLPALPVGFLMVSLISGVFEWTMLLHLSFIYCFSILALVAANALLGRKVIVRHRDRRFLNVFKLRL